MQKKDNENTRDEKHTLTDELINRAISANKLLDRKPEESYISEWTDLIQKEKGKDDVGEESSVVIFRLSDEWLALSTQVFAEVIRKRMIHTMPHRTNDLLLGCVNFRGQLWLCGSLHTVLEITPKMTSEKEFERMLAIQMGQERWILPVDEVHGVNHYDSKQLENVPVTVKKSTANYIRGILDWQGRHVAVLDEELLFHRLRRSLM